MSLIEILTVVHTRRDSSGSGGSKYTLEYWDPNKLEQKTVTKTIKEWQALNIKIIGVYNTNNSIGKAITKAITGINKGKGSSSEKGETGKTNQNSRPRFE